MAILEKPYLDLLHHIMDTGQDRGDRTGVGTRSVFGHQMRFNLEEGFPAVTTKKLAFKAMVNELLWFIGGFNDVQRLRDHKCKIWDEWQLPDGTIGPGYGVQWRSWPVACSDGYGHYEQTEVDQLAMVIDQIKNNPASRRHIVNAWNVSQLGEMALPPCHMLFQFYVEDNHLSCQLYQRSGDAFLGVPFNIASYALLTCIIADLCDLIPGDFVHTLGDAHIYHNHFDQVSEQLSRDPYDAPRIVLPPRGASIDDYALGKMTADDFKLVDYQHHPAIKAPVAV